MLLDIEYEINLGVKQKVSEQWVCSILVNNEFVVYMQWSIMQLHCNSNALQFNVNGEYNIEQSKSEEKNIRWTHLSEIHRAGQENAGIKVGILGIPTVF